jgi:putative transposase
MIDQITRRPECSVRKGCSVLGFRRQTYHDRKSGNRPEERDAELIELLRRTCARFVAWGFWMEFHYLRNEHDLKDNHKRVYRLWKEAGLNLRLPPKRSKIRREYQELLAPERINEGWAMDFVSDWVIGPDKQPIRVINIMDECSRRALWTEAHTSISAATLIKVLDQVITWRGAPAYIRCDNGPEFIANRLKLWASKHGIELKYIQPGKPSQNGLIERLNKTLRVECLDLNWFRSLKELNDRMQEWSVVYNQFRPHRNLGYKAPNTYENLNENFYFRVVAA